MSMNEKRSTGRPARGFLETSNEIEDVKVENSLRVPTDEEVKEMKTLAPVSRGLREAALRAEELRSRMSEQQNDPSMYDEFYIDPRVIPEGWDYNWKRHSTAGMEDDTYATELRQAGWEAVPAERHPELVPIGAKGAIIRKGMILMERPEEISNMAKQRELATAREAVAAKERALGQVPMGSYERNDRASGIRKSYGPMSIPTS